MKLYDAPCEANSACRTRVAFAAILVLELIHAHLPGQTRELTPIERAMSERPADAFTIARREGDGLDAAQAKKLFATAAAIQEKHLARLSEAQLTELASVYAKTLANAEAARRVQHDWLKQRERDLGIGDAQGRVELAHHWWDWLKDRNQASRLCQEALSKDPEDHAADRMLREELGLRRTSRGWVRQEPQPKPFEPRVGMSAGEIRESLGLPERISRQILDGRYIEQWTYEGRRLLVEFDCRKGQEARVLTVLSGAGHP